MNEGPGPEDGGYAFSDLRDILDLALERGAALTTDDELAVATAVRGLPGNVGAGYARLCQRRTVAWDVTSLEPNVVGSLIERGLLTTKVQDQDRLATAQRSTLVAWCRAAGLPAGGRVEALRAMLEGVPLQDGRVLVRVAHRALVRRWERWAFLEKEPDVGIRVAERLGHVRRPPWPRTSGPPVHRDRAALLGWEAAWAGLCAGSLSAEGAAEAIRDGSAEALGRLDLRRRCVQRILDAADEAARSGQVEVARGHLAAAAQNGASPTMYARARARLSEAEGDRAGALEQLRAAITVSRGEERLEVMRAGRRLARDLRVGWAPDPPLRTPPSRVLKLEFAGEVRARPAWKVGSSVLRVEEAVAASLGFAGRAVVRAEGPLVVRVAIACLCDALFLPVDGAFPVPGLTGPLDLGKPGFVERRREVIAEIFAQIRAGEAEVLVLGASARLGGCSVAGVGIVDPDPTSLREVVRALGPAGVEVALRRFLDGGWAAVAGFPDLLVLDGPEVVLPGSFPTRVPAGGRLIEVKGPGDVLRDGQRLWLDRLLGAGVPAEVVEVRS